MPRTRDHLAQVVRCHVGSHTHRDTGGTVDEQGRVGSREDTGLLELVVVVGNEIHDVLVEVPVSAWAAGAMRASV